MEATARPGAPQSDGGVIPAKAGIRRRNRWSQLLFLGALGALVLAVGVYTARYLGSATFHNARAFRVLDEVGGQFDNLQSTLTNLLTAMSPRLKDACIAGTSAFDDTLCKRMAGAYASRLALRGVKPEVVRVDTRVARLACAQGPNRQIFVVTPRGTETSYQASLCEAAPLGIELEKVQPDGTPVPGYRELYGLSGQFAQSAEAYISQAYFDEVLMVLDDGTVIGDTLAQESSLRGEASIHPAKRARINVMSAADVLRRARRELERTSPNDRTDEDKAALELPPSQPVAFSQTISGDSYRVFVRAIRPAVPLHVEAAARADVKQHDVIYLIGLSHYDLRSEIASALGPVGRFTITVLVLLALLAWPIANVRSKSSGDAISWSEVVACLTSLIIIPAVLAIAAVCVWGYQALTRWADEGASTYAQQIADVLSNEFGREAQLLTSYRKLYGPAVATNCNDAVGLPTPLEPDGPLITASVFACASGTTCPSTDGSCVVTRQSASQTTSPSAGGITDYRNWSPFSSVFATDVKGTKVGMRITAFDAPQTSKDTSYQTRRYFRSLRDGQSWSAGAYESAVSGFVAQRIFSMTDGARMLQLAVPRLNPCAGGQDCFDGIVSGGGRVHSLSAAVSPPLMKFAVIDRDTGSVIFHSDDSRSLAENFFVETEQDVDLRAAAELGRTGHFYGHYMGDDKRFYFLPMEGVPWGIVVMYSLQDLGDVSWHAGLTALAAYAGLVLLFAVALGCALIILSARHKQVARRLAAYLWHDGNRSCTYTRTGLVVFGGVVATVILYELVAPGHRVSPLTWWMIVPLVVLAAALFWQHRRGSRHACLAICLVLVSCLPAAWMALGYHELQIHALLRDGLVDASRDVERRHTIIEGDLRRWVSDERMRTERFPDTWTLTAPSRLMPVPGFALGPCHAPVATGNDWHLCVFGPPPLAESITRRSLDFWRRATWDAAAHSETQKRRIRLLETNGRLLPRCAFAAIAGEQCSFANAEYRFDMIAGNERTAVSETRITDADEAAFNSVTRLVINASAVLATLFATWLLASFATRRLFARARVPIPRATGVPPVVEIEAGVVFHRLKPATDYRPYLRPPGAEPWLPAVRVDLVCDTALETLEAAGGSAPYILEDLDIALIDGARRPSLLATLEKLVANPDVQLIITCSRSPLDRLYHPERFTESGPGNAISLNEGLRWDRVLEQFDCDVRRVMLKRHDSAELRKVDHHQAWKLCTRAERLLLHQIASGHLPNPASQLVTELAARGIVDTQTWPWPTIADPEFEQFVRSAEREADLAEWRREDARAAGKPVQKAIIAVLLIGMVIAVLWFSWSAGDQFRVVSAIVAAAVAFLGQIGQAFNFVRSGTGNK